MSDGQFGIVFLFIGSIYFFLAAIESHVHMAELIISGCITLGIITALIGFVLMIFPNPNDRKL
jgi:hypothetical protein